MHRYADARGSLLSKMYHFTWAGFSPLIGCSPCSSKPDFEDDSWLMLRPAKRRMSRMHVLQLKYMRIIIQGGWHIRLRFTTPQSEKQGFDGVGWQGWHEHVSGDAKGWEPCYEVSNANLKGKFLLSLTLFLCFSGIPNRKLEGMAKFCLSHLQSGQY